MVVHKMVVFHMCAGAVGGQCDVASQIASLMNLDIFGAQQLFIDYLLKRLFG
jgi:hypothetical protein